MSNQFDMRCPQCGATDQIKIAAEVTIHLLPDGSDVVGDHSWGSESFTLCDACGFEGEAKHFMPPRQE